MDIQKHINNISFFFICLAALIFPFSVAGTNAGLGIAFLLSLLSGQFFKGIIIFKKNHPQFFLAVCLYLLLVIIGMSWSVNKAYALDTIMHLNKWLILPVVIFLLYENKKRGYIFIGCLSLGLTLHLAACVAQYNGWLSIHMVGGSSEDDATGYIGHIAFGFVYSIWAGWLFFWGKSQEQRYLKALAWLLSSWSILMIFLAQGRSGYLIALAVVVYIIWSTLLQQKSWRFKITVGLLFLTMFIVAFNILNLQQHQKFIQTKNSIESIYYGDFEGAETRVQLWLVALEAWHKNILFGTGTSGYKYELEKKVANDIRFKENAKDLKHSHPHQLYLQSLARWGVVGLVVLLFLLWSWFASLPLNLKVNIFSPFVRISALAVIIHGFTSIGIEAFHPLTMSMFVLGLAFAFHQPQQERN